MPLLCPLAVVLENDIHLNQTLALAVWLLVAALLSSVSWSRAAALGYRGLVWNGSCLSVEIRVLYVLSLQTPSSVSYLEAPRFSPLLAPHLKESHRPFAFSVAVLFSVLT